MKKLIVFAIAILGFTAVSFGQVPVGVSATATASGTIIQPIKITKTVDMNFGNVAVSASGGTVVLTPASSRTTTGGVTLPAFALGTVTAAAFDIEGAPNYTYNITVPNTTTVVTNNVGSPAATMDVTTFLSDPTPAGKLDGTNGKQTIHVGATLAVAANQAAGTYLSGNPFTVTVNYN